VEVHLELHGLQFELFGILGLLIDYAADVVLIDGLLLRNKELLFNLSFNRQLNL